MNSVANRPLEHFRRLLAVGREALKSIVLSPRRLRPSDREAIRRRIAGDPDFARQIREFLDAEPQYQNDRAREPVVSGRSA
jgi:hypothetical protein